jgi:DNA mismatch repair protein MutS
MNLSRYFGTKFAVSKLKKFSTLKVDLDKLTPAQTQHHFFKKKYPEYLLFFQVGDFFEMFGDDALKASEILDIALMSKKKINSPPQCGFPVDKLEGKLEMMIKKGVMVAVCEQVNTQESLKNSDVKKREITRLVTPGTMIEEGLLSARKNNYLVTLYVDNLHLLSEDSFDEQSPFYMAWTDLSTGEIKVSTSLLPSLSAELVRLNPSEIIISPLLAKISYIKNILQPYFVNPTLKDTPISHTVVVNNPKENLLSNRPHSIQVSAEQLVDKIFKDHKDTLDQFSQNEIRVLSNLLEYIVGSQVGNLPYLCPPVRYVEADSMFIDSSTRMSLELTSTLSGHYAGSVLSVIDKTKTSVGSRLLSSRLTSPSLCLDQINERLDALQFFHERRHLINKVREIMKECSDLERCLQRLKLNRGGPRDLLAIATTVAAVKSVLIAITSEEYNTKYNPNDEMGVKLPKILNELLQLNQIEVEVLYEIEKAIKFDTSSNYSQGGFINEGYSTEIDQLRALSKNGEKLVMDLVDSYKSEYNLPFRLKQTKALGYFLEINAEKAKKIPKDSIFSFCQNKKSSITYKTVDLDNLERKIKHSEVDSVQKEIALFFRFSNTVVKISHIISQFASALAIIDVSSSLALQGLNTGYVRPSLTNDLQFDIKEGRHVTVESVADISSVFNSNDCLLTRDHHMWIITGANMGGKSTYLRQFALITIMAQIGSFVPASKATIGLADCVFSRVGASDDLARNKSTFMVEMLETSAILKRATKKSFIIMDEIGRGTATKDGLHIAQAVVEYIHDVIDARTLFATHYHELTRLKDVLNKIKFYNMAVVLHQNRLFFTYKIVEGIANKSYGIEVAKLAGMPSAVIERAFQLNQSE